LENNFKNVKARF